MREADGRRRHLVRSAWWASAGPRQRAVLAAALMTVALLLLLLGLSTFWPGAPQVKDAMGATAASGVAAATEPAPSGIEPGRGDGIRQLMPSGIADAGAGAGVGTGGAAIASPGPAATATPAPPARPVLDLCGVGTVSIPPRAPGAPISYETLPAPLGVHARAEAWPQVLAALESAGSERGRAAALMLRASGPLEAEATPSVWQRPQPDPTPQVRALAALARGTRDAVVLRWALGLCERDSQRAGRELPECAALSVRDLVRLEPDNAANWLRLGASLTDVRSAGQTPEAQAEARAEADEALRRAAAAPRLSLWDQRLSAAVESALPASLPGHVQLQLLITTIGIDAATVDTAGFWMLRQCPAGLAQSDASNASNASNAGNASDASQASDPKRVTCSALAQLAAERGDSLTTLGLAESLGRRLGAPASLLAAAREEQRSLLEVIVAMPDPAQPLSCDSLSQVRALVRGAATKGELATLRELRAQRVQRDAAVALPVR